jgi:23S rRNA (cytidine1920-2'-O)/16S rRNA (cytidine1409-2'-O)-methyltransferase
MRERADQILVTRKLCATRSQASDLIKSGNVLFDGEAITRPGKTLDPQTVEIVANIYVGRGGRKLESIAQRLNIEFKDKIVADIGASTGGFTDLALRLGARRVYAVDVGHDQLAPDLRQNSRVVNREGINIKNPLSLETPVDIVLADLSFISLKLVLKNILDLLRPEGEALCLFKPQFEVGPQQLTKKGIVKEEKMAQQSLEAFLTWCQEQNFPVKSVLPCPLMGKVGNQEYFIYFNRQGSKRD